MAEASLTQRFKPKLLEERRHLLDRAEHAATGAEPSEREPDMADASATIEQAQARQTQRCRPLAPGSLMTDVSGRAGAAHPAIAGGPGPPGSTLATNFGAEYQALNAAIEALRRQLQEHES